MHIAKICSAETSLVKPDVSELETGGSGISMNSDDFGETTMTKHEDWRTFLIRYLKNLGHITDRKV
jgi:hypothetical protein